LDLSFDKQIMTRSQLAVSQERAKGQGKAGRKGKKFAPFPRPFAHRLY